MYPDDSAGIHERNATRRKLAEHLEAVGVPFSMLPARNREGSMMIGLLGAPIPCESLVAVDPSAERELTLGKTEWTVVGDTAYEEELDGLVLVPAFRTEWVHESDDGTQRPACVYDEHSFADLDEIGPRPAMYRLQAPHPADGAAMATPFLVRTLAHALRPLAPEKRVELLDSKRYFARRGVSDPWEKLDIVLDERL
jgi:hypothetical protein